MTGANDDQGHKDLGQGYATLLPNGEVVGAVGAAGSSGEAARSGFGPLRIVLSAVLVNYKVRLRVASQSSFFDKPINRKSFTSGTRPKPSSHA